MNQSGRQCSIDPFQMDVDAYDLTLDSLYGTFGTAVSEKAFVSHTVVKIERSGLGIRCCTFITRGLGCLPLFEKELNGWVSRELAFTVSTGCTDDQAFEFVSAVADAMLDVQATPPDGACVEWSDALQVFGERDRFREVYFGTLFLENGKRQISMPGAPETVVLELVPLRGSEADALANSDDTVAAYFRRSRRNAADLSRR
jgi:hypothetical protein